MSRHNFLYRDKATNLARIFGDPRFVTPLFSIGGTTSVILRSRRCTKGFLNYFSAIIEFLKVVFKGEIVKFSKNCGTLAIKESGGVKVQIMEKK